MLRSVAGTHRSITMGFGLLFVGYLFLLPVVFHYFYTVPVAAVLAFFACRRLSRVNTPFGYATWLSVLLFAASCAEIVVRHALPAGLGIADAVCVCLLLGWNLLIFTGVEWVAQETGLTALRARAFREKLFSCIWLLPMPVLELVDTARLSEAGARIVSALSAALLAVGFVVVLLNLVTLYSAYARICMPEDADMPQKPSRFAFVNRIRAAQEKRARAAEAWNARKREERDAKQRKPQNKRKTK